MACSAFTGKSSPIYLLELEQFLCSPSIIPIDIQHLIRRLAVVKGFPKLYKLPGISKYFNAFYNRIE